MATEFHIALANTPGTLGHLGTILGEAGVNIEAIQGFSGGPESFVQFIPNNADQAARALEAAGIAYARREVLLVQVLDEPGMLGDVALVMADAGINIDSVYVATSGQVVLGVDDLDGAVQVAAGMAVMTPH